jgi:hypothetical protein
MDRHRGAIPIAPLIALALGDCPDAFTMARKIDAVSNETAIDS